MGEKVLVTGGAGFIGSHLVDALLNAGHEVRVFDNLDPQVHGGLREVGRWPGYMATDCETILGDMRNQDALASAIRGIDVIFNLAAAVGVGQSMYEVKRYVDVNTLGTAILLDILANTEHRVRKLIVASSMSIYGEGKYECAEHGAVYPKLRTEAQLAERDWEMRCPLCRRPVTPTTTDEEKPLYATSIYAITKKDQEEMSLTIGRAYGIPTVALRFFNVYGPRQALSNPYTGVAAIFSSRILNGQPPVIFEDGRQSRDFTHVSDIVQANLLAMEKEEMAHQVFNVGTGRSTTIFDLAQKLTERLQGRHPPQISQTFRAGDIRHCFADIRNIQAMGYAPRVDFDDGVDELIDWVRAQTATDTFDRARSELVSRGLAV